MGLRRGGREQGGAVSPTRTGARAVVNGQRRHWRKPDLHLGDGWDDCAAAVVSDRLWRTGLVTVSGLTDAEAVADLASQVMDTSAYGGFGPYGLHAVCDTRRHAHRVDGAVLTRAPVDLHTCGAALPQPPRLVLLACAQEGLAGGETLLADSRAVFDDLAREHPEAAHALSLPGAAFFGRGEDAFAAPVLEAVTEERRMVRLRQDGLIRWPKDIQRHVPALRAGLARHRQETRLRPGEGLIMDNSRWLHGRTGFTGDRLFYRAEGNPRQPLPHDQRPGEAP
ncbi:TauD/TfdA family dioxygenase [Streptomyces ehimensis]|uniref:TauD/TfdA family dioxygenase n=1 Tax=Streptomyces ehimensis TaxID=68195 RepID=A0ABV9BUR2_9ACTN